MFFFVYFMQNPQKKSHDLQNYHPQNSSYFEVTYMQSTISQKIPLLNHSHSKSSTLFRFPRQQYCKIEIVASWKYYKKVHKLFSLSL